MICHKLTSKYGRIDYFVTNKYYNLALYRNKGEYIADEMEEYNEIFSLYHDNKKVFTGTNNECLYYLHDNTSGSWEYNFKYNGYKILKEE